MKLFTLIALISPIYFEDIKKLSNSIVLLGIVFLYLIMKRHIIGDVIELVRPNRKVGLVLFFCSLFVYIYGSYGTMGPVLHIISLVLLISSYLMIRMNGLLLNILWLPLASMIILSLSENIILLSSISTIVASVMLASITFISSEITSFFKILVVIVNILAFTSLQILLGAVITIHDILMLLSFIEVIIGLIITQRLLSKAYGSHESREECRICNSNNALWEFCPYCGRNLINRLTPSRLEIIGLTLAVIFAISVLFVSIPTLAITDKGLSIIYITVQGPKQEEVSFISDRWLLYEENRLHQLEGSFSEDLILRQVLVPEQYPETKNYTVILEISSFHTRIADGWRFWPWNVTFNQQVYLKESIPILYYEISSGDQSLKVVTWKEKVVISSGYGIITKVIAVSIFINHTFDYNLGVPSGEFLNDIGDFSTNMIDRIGVSSSWNSIFFSIWYFYDMIIDYVLIVLASGVIIATALYSVSREDIAENYMLEFLPQEDLDLLLSVNNLNESRIMATGENILKNIKEGSELHGIDQQGILRELGKLESMKLLKRRLRLVNKSVNMEWRLTF